jgi:hypothetical protein
MIRRGGLALLVGVATMWLMGCATRCEEAILRRDPTSGECTPLSRCYLTDEQLAWERCEDDPCVGRDETSCLVDARCQPAYAILHVDREIYAHKYPQLIVPVGCINEPLTPQPPQPDDPIGIRRNDGVHNGVPGKHPASASRCFRGSQRVYSGCRIVPRIPSAGPPCKELSPAECSARPDCIRGNPNDNTSGCFTLDAPCAISNREIIKESSCLSNPLCEAIGTDCYCPPNMKCDCSGGEFLYCQINDRLRRCSSSADCNAGERCDNDEACIIPRTYDAPPEIPAGPKTPRCLGACVPVGCTGLGEEACDASSTCEVGNYRPICGEQPVYYGPLEEPSPAVRNAGCPGNSRCSCTSEFDGCMSRTTNLQERIERSLLVRDPEILDDPAFSLKVVLNRLAPVGQGEAFVQSLLPQIAANQMLSNGAMAPWRGSFATIYRTHSVPPSPALSQKFLSQMMTTALINRLDLASAQDCGQARISFALKQAYWNGNQRMTLIVELRVPDDGQGCKLVAQRWAELSYVADLAQRWTRLLALYDELLTPKNLAQIRTNEFVSLSGGEPWEMREFHLRPADGLLELWPVAQTLNPRKTSEPEVIAWLRDHGRDLAAGTVLIPTAYLAATSTEDGGRLRLAAGSDPQDLGTEKAVNDLSCAGCHMTETASPFVHIGERLAKKGRNEYVPSGRAVIDSFLQKELPKRLALLDRVLSGTQGLVNSDWRPTIQTRVH